MQAKNCVKNINFFLLSYILIFYTFEDNYQTMYPGVPQQSYLTAYLLFSTFRSDKYCEWKVNKYVIFCDNDCMKLGNESTRNKINKIKQCYIVVLILHSCLLSMWYVLFITKWDIRKREYFFKFYTDTISYNGTQFSWFCKFLEMFNI